MIAEDKEFTHSQRHNEGLFEGDQKQQILSAQLYNFFQLIVVMNIILPSPPKKNVIMAYF